MLPIRTKILARENPKLLDQRIVTMIEYGRSLIGAPYKWLIQKENERSIPQDMPFYSDDKEYSIICEESSHKLGSY